MTQKVAELVENKCGLRKLLSELHQNKLGQYSRDLDRAIQKLYDMEKELAEHKIGGVRVPSNLSLESVEIQYGNGGW